MARNYLGLALYSGLMVLLAWHPAAAASTSPKGAASYPPGSILIKTSERRLYLVLKNGSTISYPVAVGRQGRRWQGRSVVTRKVLQPTWAPPATIRREKPGLPKIVPPGPRNPLGAAVLVLGDGTYGIHGTNRDSSIGTAASYGCFRMHNRDVLDLYSRVRIGTSVFVLR
ncbi:MAG: L,D-transpeptidase [Parvibaculaceae bacterium]